MSANSAAIEQIKAKAGSDAEALAQMFESPTLKDNGTATGRLRAILDATEHAVVPGLQTGIQFHDRGFRKEFTDPWPSSDNQVGHFLTAVGLNFDPAKVAESFMGRKLRDWIGATPDLTDADVAVRLTVGHEKMPDPSLGTAAGGAAVGGAAGAFLMPIIPFKGPAAVTGAGAGAGLAILGAFRDQFAAATDADIQAFEDADQLLGTSPKLDGAAADGKLHSIRVVPTQRGNSYQDLLLSLYGWRLGQLVKDGKVKSGAEIGTWVRTNLM